MKTLNVLFVCFFCLPLVFLGCGETQESSNLIGATDSAQALPADDDIQGLYNLGVPRNWDQTQDPVVYVKYFRAKLLRRFGNIPEVHTIADMELKRRQGIALTPDEKTVHLTAFHRLIRDTRMIAAHSTDRHANAAEKPVMTMNHAPAAPRGNSQGNGGMSCSHGGAGAIDLNDVSGMSHAGASGRLYHCMPHGGSRQRAFRAVEIHQPLRRGLPDMPDAMYSLTECSRGNPKQHLAAKREKIDAPTTFTLT